MCAPKDVTNPASERIARFRAFPSDASASRRVMGIAKNYQRAPRRGEFALLQEYDVAGSNPVAPIHNATPIISRGGVF